MPTALADVKVVVDELTACGFIAARRLTDPAKTFVLRVLGERIAELEAGEATTACKMCGRSFLFNPALFRHEPRTCFSCRVQRNAAGRAVRISPGR